MYPLVFIYGSALWTEDYKYLKNTMPLAIIGLIIAIYHNLLYYNIIPDSITPCTQGVSCTSKQIELLGFITIPMMALISFIIITKLNFIQLSNTRNSNETK
jgi:disulfide bond formation protein DsbB